MDVQTLIQQNLAKNGALPGQTNLDTSGLFGGIEGTFRALHLNTPLTRSIFVGGLVAVGLFVAQPEFAFQNGAMRPWSAITSEEDAAGNNIRPTHVPWYLVAAGIGFAAGLVF